MGRGHDDEGSAQATVADVVAAAVTKTGRAAIVVARPGKPLTPAQCRAWVRRTLAEHMPDVVEGFLNEAVKGGCGHLKMASETMASQPAAAGRRRAKGPEDLLMDELEREFGEG